MNIFYLDEDPVTSAKRMCDQHIVKMPLESAQILSTAHRVLDGKMVEGSTSSGRKAKRWILPKWDDKYYLAAYVNHPSTVWARQSDEHYDWLYKHFKALSAEFYERFSHNHTSWLKLRMFLSKMPKKIKSNGWVDPPQCMPDAYKDEDTMTAYNVYYMSKYTDWLAAGRPMKWNGNLRRASYVSGVQCISN